MRFSLSSSVTTGLAHPILAICNSLQKVFFWDLARLNEYYNYTASANEPSMDGIEPQLAPPQWLFAGRNRGIHRRQVSEPTTTALALTPIPTLTSDTFTGNSVELSESVKRKYSMNNPLGMLEAHRTIALPKFRCNGQQVAWSVCGKWCVVAAAPNAVVVFRKGTQNT